MNNYLSYAEIALQLNIPVRTMYLFRKQGKAPSTVKVGRHLRVSPEALEVWLQQNLIK
jgi:excisionase family DNA binding protein